jgi:type I restriction enzyme S subunit
MEARLDPNFYLREFFEIEDRLTEKYGVHHLKSVIADIYRYPTFYGIEYQQSGIPVIKGENISKDGAINPDQEFDYIDEETHRSYPRTELKENDLVFTVRGIIGKVGLFKGFPTVGNINANVIKIRIKQGLNYKFFWIYLNSSIGQKLINRISSGQVQQTITVPDILKLQIPAPQPEVQYQIVEKFESAYNAKRAKEAKAKSLFDDIDIYLLERLGIETPAAIEANKTFFVRLSTISGNRFDAPAYRQMFNYDSSKFQVENLGRLAFIDPKVTFEKLKMESEISFVPMEAINERDGVIEELRSKKVNETKGFTRFQENDLIWAKITPCMQNGKSAVARNLKQGFACGSTEFYVIRPRTEAVLVDYLHHLLRNKRVLKAAQNFFSGSAGQQRVSVDFLKNFRVPVPPIEIQEEITAHIQSIRKRAKELMREAHAEVERAKAEVERMILGEAAADA